MTTINEITGDKLQSKLGNKAAYDDGYDRIFSKAAKEKMKFIEEHPIKVHTIYKERKGPCQMHDACADDKDCCCT